MSAGQPMVFTPKGLDITARGALRDPGDSGGADDSYPEGVT
jgi:hypothetical protein